MKPYYDYDVSYIVDLIEWAGLPYKVIGMSDLGDKNRAWAWTVRFDNVNNVAHEFKVKIPLIVSYYWGDIVTDVTITVNPTTGGNTN